MDRMPEMDNSMSDNTDNNGRFGEFMTSRRRVLRWMTGVSAVNMGLLTRVDATAANQEGHLFAEDFEDVPVGDVPSDFVLAGGTDQVVVNDTAVMSSQSYQMNGSHGGCWRAIARVQFDAIDEMTISGYYKRGDGETGCHSGSGAVRLNTEASSGWSEGSTVTLLRFFPDGTVKSAGTEVGKYSAYEWTEFEIGYVRDSSAGEVTQNCRIGGAETVSVTRTEHSAEEDFSALGLVSDDFTVYWDEILIEEGVDSGPPETGDDLRAIEYGETKNGEIDEGDPTGYRGYYEPVTFFGNAGDVITAEVTSDADPYLMLLDPDGNIVTENDDGSNGLDPVIEDYELTQDGEYVIVVTSYNDSATFGYELELAVTEEADFELLDFDQPTELGMSENITGNVEIVNTGSSSSTAEVVYITANGSLGTSNFIYDTDTTEVTLAPGDSMSVDGQISDFEELEESFDWAEFQTGDGVLTGFRVYDDFDADDRTVKTELFEPILIIEATSEVDLTVSDATATPGDIATVTYQISNTGSTAVGGESALVGPVLGDMPPGVNMNEGPVDDGGALDGMTWYAWTVETGETATAELELQLPEDIEPGEYEFTVEAEVESVLDSTTATITVEEGGESAFFMTAAEASPETVAPGESVSLNFNFINEGDAAGSLFAEVADSSDSSATADPYGDAFEIVDREDDGGDWNGGWEWDSIAPGETRAPSITIEVAESVSLGGYMFAIDDESPTLIQGGTVTITVAQDNTQPTAAFTITPEDPRLGDTVEFDATQSTDADGTIDTHEWFIALGDNDLQSHTTGESFLLPVYHPEEYEIQLQVTDNQGATASTSKTIVMEDDDPFTPTVHGFGFRNYSNFDWLTLDQVISRVQQSIQPELDSLLDADETLATVPLALFIAQGMEGWANGHCLGMAETVREYYRNGVPDLQGYDGSNSIGEINIAREITDNPETTPQLDPVELDIDSKQADQLFDSEYLITYIAATMAADVDGYQMDDDAVLRKIEEALSKDNYPVVDLTAGLLSGHAVLAYQILGEIDDDDKIEVAIYDPNCTADEHDPPDRSGQRQDMSANQSLTFERPSGSDTYSFTEYKYTSHGGDEEIIYDENIFVTTRSIGPDGSVSPADLFTGGPDALGTLVWEGLANNLSLGIIENESGPENALQAAIEPLSQSQMTANQPRSGVDVTIRATDGLQLESIEMQSDELREATEYKQFYLQVGTAVTSYEIEITNESDEPQELDISGSVSDGGVINETYMLAGDSQETLYANIPAEEGAEGSLSTSSQTDSGSDDPGTGLTPETLAGLGIGSIGVLYLASRMLSDDDDDQPPKPPNQR